MLIFFVGTWKILGLRTWKGIEHCKQRLTDILMGPRKILRLRTIQTMDAQFKKGTMLATGLEIVLVRFGQKLWLLYAFVIRFDLRLN